MHKALYLLLIFIICFTNCGWKENNSQGSAPRRIALVVKTLNSPFFIDMKNGAEEAAQRLNVELIVQAAEREVDVEKQMQIIENLIQTRVNAICVTPSGSKELIPAVGKANQAGIPVLVLDTRLDEAAAEKERVRFETFIGSDNYQGGKVAGEYAAKIFNGKAKLAVLEGIPGHETGDSRMNGFNEGIKDFSGMEIVASQTANWERDQGFNVMQNMLQAHPEIEGVFACNDMMALGAMEAIIAAGKSGQIKIIGFDAVEEARREIQSGGLAASVAQHPAAMGRLAVENAVKILNGESIPAYIPVEIELVTKENSDGAVR
jgi:ribose transport system substrate-binding protein